MSMRPAPRLLMLCAVSTAVTAWSQVWMLHHADLHHWSAGWTLLTFGTIVAQTAATCSFAGRYFSSWRWRVPALIWLLLLTNLELASIDTHGSNSGEGAMPAQFLVHALSASEIAALAIWVVLGDASFGQKAPFVSCAAIPLLTSVVPLHLPLTDPYCTVAWGGGMVFPGAILVETAAVFVLSAIMHFLGFRISSRGDSELSVQPIRQFSIRRLSMYALVVACYSLAIKGFLEAARVQVDWRFWLLLFADGILLAATSLAAAWAVLRNGNLARRATFFVVLTTLSGALIAGMETAFYSHLEATLGFNGPWSYQWIWVGVWWIAWTQLGCLFLASLLFLLHTAGYRFVRAAKE